MGVSIRVLEDQGREDKQCASSMVRLEPPTKAVVLHLPSAVTP